MAFCKRDISFPNFITSAYMILKHGFKTVLRKNDPDRLEQGLLYVEEVKV